MTRQFRLLSLLHVGKRARHGILVGTGVEHDALRLDVAIGAHVPVGSHELGGDGAERRRGSRVGRRVGGGGGCGVRRRRGDRVARVTLPDGAAEDVPGRRVHGGVRGALKLGPVRLVLLQFLVRRQSLGFGHLVLGLRVDDGFAGCRHFVDVRRLDGTLDRDGTLDGTLDRDGTLYRSLHLLQTGLESNRGESLVVTRHGNLLHGPALPLLALTRVLLVQDVPHLPDRRAEPVGVLVDERVLLGLGHDLRLGIGVVLLFADFPSDDSSGTRHFTPRLLRVALDRGDDRPWRRAVALVPADEPAEPSRDAVLRRRRRVVRLERSERRRVG